MYAKKTIIGAAAMLALSMAAPSHAQPVDINSGSSWSGWTIVGFSNQLGIYGSGSTTAVYEIYTTNFTFNNDSVSGSAVGGGPTGGVTGFGTGVFSTGAFANGNNILGIGVRVVSGGSITGFTPTVRFDLESDSFLADSPAVGSGNGGPNNQQQIVGSIGSGVSYGWAFRAFTQPDS